MCNGLVIGLDGGMEGEYGGRVWMDEVRLCCVVRGRLVRGCVGNRFDGWMDGLYSRK